MATAANPPSNPPAGWYDDPDQQGRRFWDGKTWTESIAPPSDESPSGKVKDPRNNTLATAGYVFAVLMPIVGAILAIPLYSRGDRRATAVLLTSFVAFIVYLLLVASSGSETTTSGGYTY